jgi:hypothetical protein
MSKQPKTVTTKNEPPKWAQPYYKDLLSRASSLSARPWEQYGGERFAGFSPEQMTAFQMITDRALSGSSTADAASNQAQATLGGQYYNPYASQRNMYAGDNPYLTGMIDAASGDVVRNYQNAIAPGIASQFSQAGAFGGSAHQQMLGEAQHQLAGQLGDIATGIRGADYDAQRAMEEAYLGRAASGYESERDRQLSAMGFAPTLANMDYMDADRLAGVGQQQQQLAQQQLNAQYGDWLQAMGWDQDQLGVLSNALGTISGAYQNQRSPNPNYQSPLETALGLFQVGAGLGI